MSRLRSLRFKIAFVFFLVTAAAFTVIWFGVVPQLEQNLKEQRLGNLRDRGDEHQVEEQLQPGHLALGGVSGPGVKTNASGQCNASLDAGATGMFQLCGSWPA